MMRPILIVAALAASAPASAQHMHHDMPPPAAGSEAPEASAPPPAPGDHAADALFDPAEMARARAALRHENGGMGASMILLDQFELFSGKGADGYRWEGEAWSGGDIDRLVLKSEGEGALHGPLERAEIQGLYSHALDPWFNVQLGVRHDIRPRPQTSYATLGIEGLAPYWFEVDAALFLSDRGDLTARIEGSHDIRLTQRLLLTLRAELDFSAQPVRALGLGSGLTNAELGLRLHYAITPRFAPYLGVHRERSVGDTARFARGAGKDAGRTGLVAGMRFWF
jgi:copper resistance protein B